jgi:cation transport ATPase
LPGDNLIGTTARVVGEANAFEAEVQDIANRASTYFVTVVILLTAITRRGERQFF